MIPDTGCRNAVNPDADARHSDISVFCDQRALLLKRIVDNDDTSEELDIHAGLMTGERGSEHIVQILVPESSRKALVLEWCVCDLYTAVWRPHLLPQLPTPNQRQFDPNAVTAGSDWLYVLGHLLHGLQFVHSKGIAHLDIKPENVLLGWDGRWKLCDFGGSRRLLDQQGQCLPTENYTDEFAAPEIRRCRTLLQQATKEGSAAPLIDGRAADVWSLGMLLLSNNTEMSLKSLHSSALYRKPLCALICFDRWLPYIDFVRNSRMTERTNIRLTDFLQIDPSRRKTVSQLIDLYEQPVHSLAVNPLFASS